MLLTCFRFPGLSGIRCIFTGKDADGITGNLSYNADAASARQSRRSLMECLQGYGLFAMAECHQVHGTDIIRDPEPCDFLAEASPINKADGMMTDRPGLGLLIRTADCQPLLLTDGKRIMALHVGWRGNRQNFPAMGVAAFCRRYGAKPAEIHAVRGPSLGYAEFKDFEKEWDESFRPWHNAETSAMNLWRLTDAQLEDAGVPKRQIYGIDICTYANSDSNFSWRRHRAQGRQGGIIWIMPRRDFIKMP